MSYNELSPEDKRAVDFAPIFFKLLVPWTVYFVQPLQGGPIKIGHTRNLDRRMVQLASHYACELRLLGIIRDAGELMEDKIHKRFSHLRIGRTEQFRPKADLIEFIGRGAVDPDADELNTTRLLRRPSLQTSFCFYELLKDGSKGKYWKTAGDSTKEEAAQFLIAILRRARRADRQTKIGGSSPSPWEAFTRYYTLFVSVHGKKLEYLLPFGLVNVARLDKGTGKDVHVYVAWDYLTFEDCVYLVRDRLNKSEHSNASEFYEAGCHKFGERFQRLFQFKPKRSKRKRAVATPSAN